MKKFLIVLCSVLVLAVGVLTYSVIKKPEEKLVVQTPIYYTVKFYDSEKLLIETVEVEKSKAVRAPIATKDSDQYNVYTFDKWIFEDGTDATDSLKSVDADMSVYANFIESQPQYTIKFYDEETLLYSYTVKRGGSLSCPSGETKTTDYFTYSFEYWEGEYGGRYYDETIIADVNKDLIINARYKFASQHTPYPVELYDSITKEFIGTVDLMHNTTLPNDLPGAILFEDTNGVKYENQVLYWKYENGSRITGKFNITKGTKLYAVNSGMVYGKEDGAVKIEFTLSEDKSYYSVGNIQIDIYPTILNNIPVTHVLPNAYTADVNYGNGELIIPDGITTLESGAIAGLNNISKLSLPGTLKSVLGTQNISLTDGATVGGTLEFRGPVGSWVGISGPQSFFDNDTYKSIIMNGELTTDTLDLDGATEVKSYTLSMFSGVRKLIVPSTVKKFDLLTLSSLLISEVNYIGDINDWVTIDFVDSCNTEYILRINGQIVTSVVIDKAKTINSRAFSRVSSIVTVEIGDSVEEIGARAFVLCEGLSFVKLSSNIKLMNYDSFVSCSKLKTIYLPILASGAQVLDPFDGVIVYTGYTASGLTEAGFDLSSAKSIRYNYTYEQYIAESN